MTGGLQGPTYTTPHRLARKSSTSPIVMVIWTTSAMQWGGLNGPPLNLAETSGVVYILHMNAMTFDTHRFVKKLTAAGMPEAQAEVLAEEQAALIDQKLVTKEHFDAKLETLESKITGELRLTKWMLGIVIAATAIPLVRDLF